MDETVSEHLGYRRRQFADGLGVSLSTVNNWLKAGDVKHVKIRGTIIIPVSEAQRLLDVQGGHDVA